MEDLREKLEELNIQADNEREQKARIKGKLDMLTKSLKNLGLTFKNSATEINKLKKSLLTDNKKLENIIKELQDSYAEKLEN